MNMIRISGIPVSRLCRDLEEDGVSFALSIPDPVHHLPRIRLYRGEATATTMLRAIDEFMNETGVGRDELVMCMSKEAEDRFVAYWS